MFNLFTIVLYNTQQEESILNRKIQKNYYYRKPFTDYSIKTLYLYSQFKKGVIWIYVQQT